MNITQDISDDTVTIDDQKFSGEFFRMFRPAQRGKLFQVYFEMGVVRIRTFRLNGFLNFIVRMFECQ